MLTPSVEDGLALLRAQTDGLLAELRALTPAQWRATTPCAPWDVAAVAAHLAVGADYFITAVRRALHGAPGAERTPAERAAAIAQLAARGPAAIVEALANAADRFELTVRSVPPLKLDTPALHNHGPRPIRWFVVHRLGEVVVHRWDIGAAIGRPTPPAEDAAAFLVPTLLEVNLPVWYTRGPRGRGQVRLVVRERTPRAWLLDADGERLRAIWHGEGVVPRVDLSAPDLVLVLYGRLHLADLVAAGRVQAHGPDAVERFASLLGPP
jgi:uncharacterized protein (TIGR03083 family)